MPNADVVHRIDPMPQYWQLFTELKMHHKSGLPNEGC